ncbi:MAG: hypothetical protein ACJA1C_001047 [Crocinitomicaceae bacterium]|jgi:hypothetical protein
MKKSNRNFLVFGLPLLIIAFIGLVMNEWYKASESIEEFKLVKISSKVERVVFGKNDIVILETDRNFIYHIDYKNPGMKKYSNVRISEIIQDGDSIVKSKGSLSIRVFRNSSPNDYYDLSGTGGFPGLNQLVE